VIDKQSKKERFIDGTGGLYPHIEGARPLQVAHEELLGLYLCTVEEQEVLIGPEARLLG
jgi:hypothetical protein